MEKSTREMEAIREREAEALERNQIVLSPGQLVAKRFFRNRLAVVGLCVLVAMILFCFVGGMLSPYKETELFYIDKTTGEEVSMYDHEAIKDALLNVKAPPSKAHPLGTDQMGFDVLTRLMYGGRISLMVGVIVVLVELLIGVTLGGIAGYYGGKVDMVIMRLAEVFLSLPFIPLMLIIASAMIYLKVPPQNKIYYIMIIMGVIYWASVARMIRGQILTLRETEYMQAAEATGIPTRKKIFRHLIPNVMPLIIVIGTMDLGSIILMESTMSFLGVGVSAPYASWGNMVQSVVDNTVMSAHPNIWIPPGICILLTVMAFNFVGDGLRDAFDPKMKR